MIGALAIPLPRSAFRGQRSLRAGAARRATGSRRATLSPRNANYTIDVRARRRGAHADGPRDAGLDATSPASPATELQFHLYYNAWRNDESTWMREHG